MHIMLFEKIKKLSHNFIIYEETSIHPIQQRKLCVNPSNLLSKNIV